MKSGNQTKSRYYAGLLAVFLGCLGAHNFYLGYTGKGVAQALITLLGGCILIGPLISGIWGLTEGILLFTGRIRTDARGTALDNSFSLRELFFDVL